MHCLVALSNIWSIILHINKHVFLKIMEISQYNKYGLKNNQQPVWYFTDKIPLQALFVEDGKMERGAFLEVPSFVFWTYPTLQECLQHPQCLTFISRFPSSFDLCLILHWIFSPPDVEVTAGFSRGCQGSAERGDHERRRHSGETGYNQPLLHRSAGAQGHQPRGRLVKHFSWGSWFRVSHRLITS